MTRIVFLRHFETRVEPDVPAAEWELSADGRAAEERFLAEADLDRFAAVYTSPEAKARHTAERAAEEAGVDLRVRDGLAEVDRSAEGFVDDHETYLAMVEAWLAGEAGFAWEEPGAVRERARRVVGEMDAEAGPVLAVTHGLWIAHLIGAVTDADPHTAWEDLGFGETRELETGDVLDALA